MQSIPKGINFLYHLGDLNRAQTILPMCLQQESSLGSCRWEWRFRWKVHEIWSHFVKINDDKAVERSCTCLHLIGEYVHCLGAERKGLTADYWDSAAEEGRSFAIFGSKNLVYDSLRILKFYQNKYFYVSRHSLCVSSDHYKWTKTRVHTYCFFL